MREPRGTAKSDPDAVLGTVQWQWLEREIQASVADVLFIGSGIQVRLARRVSLVLQPTCGAGGALALRLVSRRRYSFPIDESASPGWSSLQHGGGCFRSSLITTREPAHAPSC